jgi:hypothetical protein
MNVVLLHVGAKEDVKTFGMILSVIVIDSMVEETVRSMAVHWYNHVMGEANVWMLIMDSLNVSMITSDDKVHLKTTFDLPVLVIIDNRYILYLLSNHFCFYQGVHPATFNASHSQAKFTFNSNVTLKPQFSFRMRTRQSYAVIFATSNQKLIVRIDNGTLNVTYNLGGAPGNILSGKYYIILIILIIG